jgi:hypothetical protein
VAALKVFRTHLGFYDTIVAARSRKAALAFWDAPPSLFATGFAAVTDDPAAVAAAMAQPGVVLKRPYGSRGPFKQHPDLPRLAASTGRDRTRKAR